MELVKHSQRTNRAPCRDCGAEGLYWAHEAGGKTGRKYCQDHRSANWTLIEANGSRHFCRDGAQTDQNPDEADAGTVEIVSDEPVTAVAAPAPSAPTPATPAPNSAMAAFQAFIDLVAPKVDAEQVHAIIDARLRDVIPTVRVEVTRDGVTRQVEGLTHKSLPVVLVILGTGKNVMMVGPAGTGKSHIASQAAEALGLESYSISLNPQTPASALLGYMNATGEYVPTAFRNAYENGGVFHFDEVDNSHPAILATINAALANGGMAFADAGTHGMVKRHADFRCVASANTYGNGPDRAYVGRQAMDAATKDRFEIVDIPVDEALEEALCVSTGLDAGKVSQVLEYVRFLRTQALEYKLPLVFSPRRSHGMCTLLATGQISARQAEEISVRRGISETDWNKISYGAPRVTSYGI